MEIELEFVGAAQTVTGSRHLVRGPNFSLLLECGLFQGRRQESRERNENLGLDPSTITAVVLSHAHIDHSGALPLLCKQGYTGPIYVTPATRDLCAVMLEDAAMIQASDAKYINRKIEEGELDGDPIEPLYTKADVAKALGQMISIPYHMRHELLPGVSVRFLDAGHVLGSAIVVLDFVDERGEQRLVFTGDLGRHHLPLLRDPEVPSGATALLMESTYGDRFHPPIEEMDEQLASIVKRTVDRGGKVIIPSFALERAQEVVFSLKKLRLAGRIPPIPVFVDSPLAVGITEVFRLHPECLDEEARALLEGGDSPFEFPGLRYVSSVEDSMAIDMQKEPCIVISASGMCEAGRVLHHLRTSIEDPKCSIVIIGFQAQHTLGRRLVERRARVRVFGIERELRAEVFVLNGFSAHADQNDLLAFASKVAEQGNLRWATLVHGEPQAQAVLAGLLKERGIAPVHTPAPHAKLTL